jgi:hypothetical protein
MRDRPACRGSSCRVRDAPSSPAGHQTGRRPRPKRVLCPHTARPEIPEGFDIRYLISRVRLPQSLQPYGTPSKISRCCGDDWHEFFDRAVDGVANCPGRAVHVLQCGRDLFQEQHRAFGGQHRVLALDLPDLRQRFLHPRNRRLRAPTEGTAPKARCKLPERSFRRGHLPSSSPALVSPGSVPERQRIVSRVKRSRWAPESSSSCTDNGGKY